jgi:hypothetical protein
MSIRFLENASTVKKTMMWVVVATVISGCSDCGKESSTDPSASTSSATIGDTPGQPANNHIAPARTLPPEMRPAMRIGITPADAGH